MILRRKIDCYKENRYLFLRKNMCIAASSKLHMFS